MIRYALYEKKRVNDKSRFKLLEVKSFWGIPYSIVCKTYDFRGPRRELINVRRAGATGGNDMSIIYSYDVYCLYDSRNWFTAYDIDGDNGERLRTSMIAIAKRYQDREDVRQAERLKLKARKAADKKLKYRKIFP